MKRILFFAACLLFLGTSAVSCERSGETEVSEKSLSGYVPAPGEENHAGLIESVYRDAEGGTLVFPDGEYVIDRDVILDCDVILSGHTSFRVTENGSFTVNGEFYAGKRRIFSGDGRVRINMNTGCGFTDWFSYDGIKDTALVQKAFDSLNRLAVTDELSVSGIVISAPITVVGSGSHRVGLNASGRCTRLFTIRSGGVSFENFRFDMSQTGNGAVCFYADTADCDIEGFTLKDCYIDGAHTAITDADGEFSVTGTLLDGVMFREARGTQIVMRDFAKNTRLIGVAVLRRHSDTVSCGMPGAVFENASDMLFEHFDVNGDFTDEGTGGHGVIFRNCKNVTMRRSLMEYISGTGFIIENCSGFDFENVQAYTFAGYGFCIDGLTDSVFNVVKATYNNAAGRSDPEYENYYIKNCRNLTMNSVISNGARGAGMTLSGNREVKVNGFLYCDRLPGGKGAALLDAGGNSGVGITGFIDCSALYGKSLVLTGDGVTVRSAMLSSGEWAADVVDGTH